jgi:predicted porin
MKKSLLALAVLGAFAGVASAQSSVTLFGIIDVNARYLDNGGGKQYQMGQDGINSSRLGFRGTEDLGGGMAASFWLEGALNPDVGTATGQSWQRRSTVSLSGKFGEARFGRDYTATFWNSTIFDPFGTNGLGSSGNIFLVVPATPAGGGFGTLVRANNMMGYFLPSGIAGGLYGQVQVAAGENAYGNKYFGGRIGYAAGPFNVAGAYGKTEVNGNVDGDQYNFGGSWNFGFMTLSGYYGDISIGNLDQSNWYIGASAPIGLWTVRGTYGAVNRKGIDYGVDINSQDAQQFAVGFQYDLSKRTALYGTYSKIANDGNSTNGANFIVGGLANVAGGGAVRGQDSQGYEFGIRHSF